MKTGERAKESLLLIKIQSAKDVHCFIEWCRRDVILLQNLSKSEEDVHTNLAYFIVGQFTEFAGADMLQYIYCMPASMKLVCMI